MSVLKIVTNLYDRENAAANLIRYLYRKSKYTGGMSVDPAYAIEQMDMVQQCFDQQTGRRMYHFILAFSYKESQHISSANMLSVAAYDICEHFASEYQIVFAIHWNDYRWHIHFAMNPVSFVNGRKYHPNKYEDWELACHIRDVCCITNLQINYGDRETLDDIEL